MCLRARKNCLKTNILIKLKTFWIWTEFQKSTKHALWVRPVLSWAYHALIYDHFLPLTLIDSALFLRRQIAKQLHMSLKELTNGNQKSHRAEHTKPLLLWYRLFYCIPLVLLLFPPTHWDVATSQCLRRQSWFTNCSSDHVTASFHALSQETVSESAGF